MQALSSQGKLIGNLSQHWERRRAASGMSEPHAEGHGTAFSIALEREAGALGTAIARELGVRLGWQVYDHELLERIAQDMGARASLLESVDERSKSWLLETVETFMAVPAVSEMAFVRHLIETVLALGTLGECIIVGRGSPFILPPATTLRVRLIGHLAERIGRVKKLFDLTHAEAEKETTRIDHERFRFTQTHFRKNVSEPHNYDLILNTSRCSVAACVDSITAALRHQQAPLMDRKT